MEVKELIDLLPEDFEKACYEKKAIKRKRIIKNPIDLIVLILYYLYDNHSLVDVSQFAIIKNVGKISDTALTKRFIQCKDWISWMISKMIPNEIIHYKKPTELELYHVIAFDAPDIVQKGAIKKTWHLHYGVDLFSLTCSQFKITEQSIGESLENFIIKKKDLIIADRAYGTITSIEHCLKNGGDFIIRKKINHLISEKNRSIWREMKLVSFLIYMMILPNKETVLINDFLELSKNAFIEKRKIPRQQLCQFY